MPIIKTSAEELARSVRIKEGWYHAKVKEVKAEPSKDKSSINYNWYFLIDDSGVEREYKHSVNAAVWASLGIPIVEAVLSEEGKPFKVNKDSGENFEFDTDEAAGRPLCIKFEPETYQGNIINKPKVFMPGYIDIDNIPF